MPEPSAPPAFNPFDVSVEENPHNFHVNNNGLTQVESDEAYARRLQEEEEAARASRFSQSFSRPSYAHVAPPQSQQALSSSSSSTFRSDVEIARQTQQELRDMRIAQQLQGYEQRRTAHVVQTSSRSVAHRKPASSSGCTRRRWITAITMLVIVGVLVFLVLFYGTAIWDRIGGIGELPPFFSWDETPPDTNGEQFKQWNVKGNKGLKLTVVNALTSDWHDIFDIAIDDWNAAPALELTVTMADQPDPECDTIPGVMKACNDFYGKDGGWSGLNEAWLDSKGYITASTAKMNESFLQKSGYAEKQYVCCHELGHGYGLPHRDVNPGNNNLGTCLDYTTSFQSNIHPDEVDFANLENLYGTIPGRRFLSDNDLDKKEIHNLGIISKQRSYKDGRLLYKSETREIYEEKLSNGGRIISTLLLAK